MAVYLRNYDFEGKIYKATITEKRMRSSIRLTFHAKVDELHISKRFEVSLEEVDQFVIKCLPRLVKRVERKNKPTENGFYILGKRYPLEAASAEESLAIHKAEAKALFLSRLRYYESIMKPKQPYKLSVREASSRYGSNSSKTHTIMLSLVLYSFTLDVIDSVVVHELAHDSFRNHGKRFYEKVLKYCPNYYELRKRLINNLYNPDMKPGMEMKEEDEDNDLE